MTFGSRRLTLSQKEPKPPRQRQAEPQLDRLPFHWLDDIKDRDAQTEPITDPEQLPLGRAGTKYDHARWQVSDYHLDTATLAMGDRHILLEALLAKRQANQDRIAALGRLAKAAEMARRNLQGTTPCYCSSSPHEDYCGELLNAVGQARSLLSEAQPSLSSSGGDEDG